MPYIGTGGDFFVGDVMVGVDSTLVSVDEPRASIPDDFVLFQNYPNPFNPSTTIEFDLPLDQRVTLKIYNVLGEEVKTLFEDFRKVGSGVYIYRLKTGDLSVTRKMALMR
ncbi:T9SS type A sorting domain-containing protein [candidate division KSB1 bacterium]|nr:T9SS type A sorting domain-containing protein [candidate division KSB1 bacterium]NIR71874.1 T9SS type A sorting domain-containing protein [candidate division KSB1 bacterium]NIS26441.1 T9SS type A sorting domain-containing protein [candidate division KSB1 bacterium]NIT73211.1 T9SS type A sorting domain-containing protein [candidate division KSB1 bacterium]NIU27125.1 T9SS type A sorting domain-containing protein [candidate division KSB1 bacterium]